MDENNQTNQNTQDVQSMGFQVPQQSLSPVEPQIQQGQDQKNPGLQPAKLVEPMQEATQVEIPVEVTTAQIQEPVVEQEAQFTPVATQISQAPQPTSEPAESMQPVVPAQPVQQPVQQPTQPTQTTPQEQSTSSYESAGAQDRFLATTIDFVILYVIGGILSKILTPLVYAFGVNFESNSYSLFLSWVYFIGSFTLLKGQTVGMKALKIKVQSKDTGKVPDIFSLILREVVGKFVSGMVLLLGHLWMLWDRDKETWHDKISGTVTVKLR